MTPAPLASPPAGSKNFDSNQSDSSDTTADQPRPIVTRFAPSPTGFLHIGGVRTALFNWLFARHSDGQFLLRIEDTDRTRSTQAAVDAILDGMRWLGLDWDGAPIYQSHRAERHAAVAQQLLDSGQAYPCYLTPEELAAMRAEAKANHTAFRLRSPWRDTLPDLRPPDLRPVVRLRAPRSGSTNIVDQVQGAVTVDNSELDDFILLRSDGSPTYMLSVVVDDYDMGVTDIIRGDDHLNNAFRQLALIRAMGWDAPTYAHIPLIHGADGTKLSKRHGALGVDVYRDELGCLPEAVVNYLLRLGWGHGDDEIISRAQAVRWFALEQVGRSPSRFDYAKLENLNTHYIRTAEDARLAKLVAERLETERLATDNAAAKSSLNKTDIALLTRAMPILKIRAKTLAELTESTAFLFAPMPLTMEAKAVRILKETSTDILLSIAKQLESLNTPDKWTVPAIEKNLRIEAEKADVGLGKLAQPLRAALTGRTVSPGIFDVIFLLGREECRKRLNVALDFQAKEG